MDPMHDTTSHVRIPSNSVLPASYPDEAYTLPARSAVAISIISNSRLLRESLPVLLGEHIDMWLAATYPANTGRTPELPNPKGHVALLDSNIGQDLALQWTVYWCNRTPPARVLVMELANDIDVIVACIEAGANGYTLRDASVQEVATAITGICKGVARCSPEVTAELFARLAAARRAERDQRLDNGVMPLTGRELEVLSCVAKGYTNKEIAKELVIQVPTVKNHMHNILNKLDFRHRWEAAQYARERGWLNARL
jgi:DNA-binding NarL/FixJ family response regulator